MILSLYYPLDINVSITQKTTGEKDTETVVEGNKKPNRTKIRVNITETENPELLQRTEVSRG